MRSRILFPALLLLTATQQAQQAGDVVIAARPARTAIATEGRPALGPATAPVTVVVFSDFQCPYCRDAAADLREIRRIEGDRVRIVFRHFPLPGHDRARRAAEAAECAARSGRFWPMHDAIFANQNALSESDLTRYAAAAGVDAEEFAKCLDSGAALLAIETDHHDGLEAGVDGTPEIFINGRRFTGFRAVDTLRARIAKEHGFATAAEFARLEVTKHDYLRHTRLMPR